MSPARAFRLVARAEAVTWALLLLGMVLKYVTETTELGVRVFGMAHGVVFIAYCLTAVLVAIDHRWSAKRGLAALLCAIPPFATLLFERNVERVKPLGERWLTPQVKGADLSVGERAVAWLVTHPGLAAVIFVVAVAGLTGVALLVGPPGR